MTFTEAAVEVLRLVGKPLHYKKITEVAIERNLLSHVGKTPEVTMSSRLATMVKRDRGEAPIIKVKPGVFGLREFSEEQLADLSGDVDELPEAEVTENDNAKPEEATEAAPSANGEAEPPARPSLLLQRKPLPGADVFPEEDDDDEPILGGEEEDDDDDDEGEGGEAGEGSAAGESRSARRRRKRRRRGGGDEGDEARARDDRDSRDRDNRDRDNRDRERDNRNGRDGRRDERRAGRDERRANRDERRDNRDREGRDERRNELVLDMSREPADGDLLGKELADAVASVLSQAGPRGLPAIRVADMLVRKGRLQGDPNLLLPTVMAAVRADVARRRHEPRPRFRVEGSTLVLTDFLLPHEVVRAEQDVLRAAAQQRDRVRRAFLRKLSELPAAGLAELLATWLNAEGVVGLHAVRRPNAAAGELHLAGTLRRGPEEVRIAVIVCRDGRELGREKVIEARGALHYYGNASTAWLISLGSVMSGAREEAAAPASQPIALFDGLGLASAMERVGVGIGVQQVSISSLDFELLDQLRGSAARDRDAGARDRDDGRRDERNRDGRDRQRERERDGRDRPRLTLERPPQVREEGDEGEEPVEALEAGVGEGVDTEVAANGAEADAASAEGAAEREGGRRRRRRRRRKGRGGDGQAPGAVAEGGEAAELADADDNDEDDDEGEAELAAEDAGLADEVLRDRYDDADERVGVADEDAERVSRELEAEDVDDPVEPGIDDDDDEDDEGDEPAAAYGDDDDEDRERQEPED